MHHFVSCYLSTLILKKKIFVSFSSESFANICDGWNKIWPVWLIIPNILLVKMKKFITSRLFFFLFLIGIHEHCWYLWSAVIIIILKHAIGLLHAPFASVETSRSICLFSRRKSPFFPPFWISFSFVRYLSARWCSVWGLIVMCVSVPRRYRRRFPANIPVSQRCLILSINRKFSALKAQLWNDEE